MDVIEAIMNRHSYRGKYRNEAVPRKDLITILEAGLAAPSGCNMQTTSLIAVDDPHILEGLHRMIDPPVAETAPAAICAPSPIVISPITMLCAPNLTLSPIIGPRIALPLLPTVTPWRTSTFFPHFSG